MLGFFKKFTGGAPKALATPDDGKAGSASNAKKNLCNISETLGFSKPPLDRTNTQKEQDGFRDAFEQIASSMPDCVERSIVLLLNHFEYERRKHKRHQNDSPLIDSPSKVVAIIENVKQQLKVEKLNSSKTDQISQKLVKSFEAHVAAAAAAAASTASGNATTIDSTGTEQGKSTDISPVKEGRQRKIIKKKSGNELDDLIKEVNLLLKEIRPLNIEQTLDLVDKTKSCQAQIVNQDVVLLLGVTGSGKSTTIQFLAGSKMEKVEIEGLPHIAPVGFRNKKMNEFKTSPAGKSETRYINAVKIDLKGLGCTETQKDIIICDSPGFGDTEGPAVDIANGIGVADAMRQCKSIKVVIILSNQLGDRLEGLMKLTRLLVKLFDSIPRHLESFVYLFTKWDPEDATVIHKKIEQKEKILNEEDGSDENFVALVQDIIEKTMDGATIVDPLKNEPIPIWQEILEAPSIEDPASVVKNFVTPESLEYLFRQLDKDKDSVRNALERLDIPLANYKMKQMARLSQDLKIIESKNALNDCIDEVTKEITKAVADYRAIIVRVVADETPPNEADCTSLAKVIKQLLNFEVLRAEHLQDKADLKSFVFLRTIKSANLLSTKFLTVFDRSKWFGSAGDEHGMDSRSIEFVTSVSIMVKVFELKDAIIMVNLDESLQLDDWKEDLIAKIDESCQDCSKHVVGNYFAACEDVRKSITSFQLDVFASNMNFVKCVEEPFQQYLSNGANEDTRHYETLVQRFESFVNKSMVERALEAIQGDTMDQKQAEIALGAIELLEPSTYPASLGKHVSIASMEKRYKDVLGAVCKKVLGYIESTEQLLDVNIEVIDYKSVAELLQSIMLLRDREAVAHSTFEKYKLLLERIKHSCSASREFLYGQVMRILSDGEVQVSVAANKAANLLSAKTHLESIPEAYDQSFDGFKVDFAHILVQLSDKLQPDQLSLNNQDPIKKLLEKIALLKTISRECHLKIPLVGQILQVFGKLLKIASAEMEKLLGNGINYTADYEILKACLTLHYEFLNADFSELKDANENLQYFLHQYVDDFQSTLERRLNPLSSQIGKLEINNIIVEWLSYLKEIRDFYDHNTVPEHFVSSAVLYKRLFQEIPEKFLVEWCGKKEGHLAVYHKKIMSILQEESQTLNPGVLHKLNSNVQASICLDRFLPEEASPKFMQISQSISEKVKKTITNTKVKLVTAAENNRFEDLALGLQEGDLSNPEMADYAYEVKSDIVAIILKNLSELVEEIDEKTKSTKLPKVETMSLIYAAQTNKVALIKALQDRRIQSSVNEVQVLLSSMVEKIQNCFALFLSERVAKFQELEDFLSVEKSFAYIRSRVDVCSDLEVSLGETLKEHIESLIAEKKQGLKKYLEHLNHLFSDIKEYREEISKKSPVKVFDNLTIVAKSSNFGTDKLYADTLQNMQKSLTDQIILKLNKDKDNRNLDDFEDSYQEVEELSVLMPEVVKDGYAATLLECSKVLQSRRKEQEQLMKSSGLDYTGGIKGFKAFYNEKAFANAAILKRSLVGEFQRAVSNLSRSISTDLVHFLAEYPPLDASISRYLDTLRELSDHENSMYGKVSSAYSMATSIEGRKRKVKEYEYVQRQFRDPRGITFWKEVKIEKIAKNNRHYSYLLVDNEGIGALSRDLLMKAQSAFQKFLKPYSIKDYDALMKYSNSAEFKTFTLICGVYSLMEDVNVGMQKAGCNPYARFNEIADSFEELHNVFNNALSVVQFERLNAVMDVAIKIHPFFSTIKLYDLPETASQDDRKLVAIAKEKIAACDDYTKMKSKLAESVHQYDQILKKGIVHNTDLSGTFNARDAFYQKYSDSYKALSTIKLVGDHVDNSIINIATIEEETKSTMKTDILELTNWLVDQVNSFPTSGTKAYEDFNIKYDNYRAIKDKGDDFLKGIAETENKKVLSRFEKRVEEIMESWPSSESKTRSKLVNSMVDLKQISAIIPGFKDIVKDKLDRFTSAIKAANAMDIGYIGVELKKHENTLIGQLLINETAALNGYALQLKNAKTSRFKYSDVLKLLEIDGSESLKSKQDGLEAHYLAFDSEYDSYINEGLLNTASTIRKLLKEASNLKYSNIEFPERVRHIMAHVCAVWTLEHYKSTVSKDGSTEGQNRDSKSDELLRPHAAQVIAILNLLGLNKVETVGSDSYADVLEELDEKSKSCKQRSQAEKEKELLRNMKTIRNHMAQIFTGEGKSVTLAITATTLALLGCSVDCACYSSYLSERDYDTFQSLFAKFNVQNFIRYGTFHKLCEDFINEKGNIRTLVEGFVSGKLVDAARGASDNRPKVLLIDEVDVFFSKDFYGNIYKPLAGIRDLTVTSLIKHMWKNRNIKPFNFRTVSSSTEYRLCCERFSSCPELIAECVKSFLDDLTSFETLEDMQVIENDRIGYKDQDGISFSINYGYKTTLAYFKAHEAKPPKITAESLAKKIAFLIDCGNFSYAEVPKQYTSIIGVTGTLKTLSQPEKDLLTKAYNIEQFTYIPSVYTANTANGKDGLWRHDNPDDCKIRKEVGIFREYVQEIRKRLNGSQTTEYKRAVLVFFESFTKLKRFYDSDDFEQYKSEVEFIHEGTSKASKEHFINQATLSGKITLLVRIFGRGVDFVCYDEKLLNNGGIHVIQTFVSDEVSEETQIMGRTARQGNSGSFSMVIVDAELERFGIKAADVERMQSTGNLYSEIHKKRCEYFAQNYPESMRHVENILEYHKASTKFLSDMHSEDKAATKAFLVKQNKGPEAAEVVWRIVVVMDATGSMGNCINKAKNTVKDMFGRLNATLESTNISISMQYSVYRNYHQTAGEISQYSSWESKPEGLKQFMEAVTAMGGLPGGEGVEVGLTHARLEHEKDPINHVIVIGDAPANSQQEVVDKRAAHHGESYWKTTKFNQPKYWKDETQTLAGDGVVVDAFYIHSWAAESFKQIASCGKGTCNFVDVNNSKGAEDLMNSISRTVLREGGGDRELGKKLEDEYIKKFCVGFTADA